MQEVYIGRDRAMFHVGSESVSWETFCRMMHSLRKLSGKQHEVTGLRGIGRTNAWKLCQKTFLGLHELDPDTWWF